MNPSNHAILLTIDVEDWFQVENFKQCIPYSSWPSYELRVEKNTHRLLDLLDSVSLINPQLATDSVQLSIENTPQTKETPLREADRSFSVSSLRGVSPTGWRQETEKTKQSQQSCESCQITPKATFFILGWIAGRLPHLVREIHSRGHEVASHGYSHNLCTDFSPKDLRTDLIDSKNFLEDIIGNRVYGYRAPSFSINHDILKIIEECGYLYDSSFNSFGLHRRYGHLDLSQNGRRGIALQISSNQQPATSTNHQSSIVNRQSSIFYELPISNIKIGTRVFPWGGGAYFRLTPFPLFKIGVQFILRQENAYLLYLHPWEIDPEQPKINEASTFYRFRHYVNLRKTHSKLSKFIRNFKQHRFITCHQYLEEIITKTRNNEITKGIHKNKKP